MASKSYSDELKAAVMSALLSGQSVAQVARDYNLPYKTVWSWKSTSLVGNFSEQKRAVIGDLVIDYLTTLLETLRVQQEFFRDPNWLKLQGASELAVLHGVSADKGFRLLEALSSSEQTE